MRRQLVPFAVLALGICLGLPGLAIATGQVPAYQSGSELKRLPPPLDANQFKDRATRGAYGIAKRSPKLLAQLPCYCYCDRSVGHKSLYSCFVDKHGADCNICQQQAYLAERLAKKRLPIKAIRDAMNRGDWSAVSLP